jgi:hypothetical protein
MWKKAHVEELKVGRDWVKSVLVHPIQLIIPLEVDQCGEDVEDHWN